MNNGMDNYIDSLQDWSKIDYYGNNYELTNSDWYNTTLVPTWDCTEEEKQEETIKVTWSDIAEQTLDNELINN